MEYEEITIKEYFSRKIKSVRKSMGKTQEEFAEMLGVSISTYKKMEGKKTLPSVETLFRLRDITGRPMDYFIIEPTGDADESWTIIQTCDDISKLDLFARLVTYFGGGKTKEIFNK